MDARQVSSVFSGVVIFNIAESVALHLIGKFTTGNQLNVQKFGSVLEIEVAWSKR